MLGEVPRLEDVYLHRWDQAGPRSNQESQVQLPIRKGTASSLPFRAASSLLAPKADDGHSTRRQCSVDGKPGIGRLAEIGSFVHKNDCTTLAEFDARPSRAPERMALRLIAPDLAFLNTQALLVLHRRRVLALIPKRRSSLLSRRVRCDSDCNKSVYQPKD